MAGHRGAMRRTLAGKLRALHSTEFENLVYDLLVRRGLQNVRWRTPGADGGRDIEGTHSTVDFSGSFSVEQWYIECKRYRHAIGWPLLYEKIAYATNHDVNFLLLCTTATTSPRCKDEISKWNQAQHVPAIRIWERPDIERLLLNDAHLLSKYRLSPDSSPQGSVPIDLLRLLVRVANSVYGEQSLKAEPSSSVEFTAALSEMIDLQAEELTSSAPLTSRSLRPDRDLYAWCNSNRTAAWADWDAYAVRTILCAIKFYSRCQSIVVELVGPGSGISSEFRVKMRTAVTPTLREALNCICGIANFEWSLEGSDVVLIRRRHGKHGSMRAKRTG